MHTHRAERRRTRPLLALIVAIAAALAIAFAAGCGDDEDAVAVADEAAAAEHQHDDGVTEAAPHLHTEAAHAFQDQMRKLWVDHVTWTRLAIISFLDDLPDLEPTVARLLENQSQIGDAIKPFYGEAAGDRLTELLEEHITGAVDLLAAAKAGHSKELAQANAAWYRNGNQIADFLSEANPDNWPRKVMRSMMRTHLDQTIDQATQRLQGDHAAEIRTYDEIQDHILAMADALSDGIAAQFPAKFE